MPLFVARFPPYSLKDHLSPKRPRLCTQGTQTDLSFCTVAPVLKVTDVTGIGAGACATEVLKVTDVTALQVLKVTDVTAQVTCADATEAAESPTEIEASDPETDAQRKDWLTLWTSTFDPEEGRYTAAYVELND